MEHSGRNVKSRPVRLEKDPIVEAVFEIRFVPDHPSAGDILPGLLFAKLKSRFPQLDRLPFASVPREVQLQDPQLRYTPRLRLSGAEFVVMIGDQLLSVNALRPYAGWHAYRPVILEVLAIAKESTLIRNLERYSIKYMNLLRREKTEDVSLSYRLVEFSGRLGRHTLTSGDAYVRCEISSHGYQSIVEFAATAEVNTMKKEVLRGAMLSIDTAHTEKPDELWNDVAANIDAVHEAEKEIFFDLLSDAAGEEFGAIW